MNPLIRWIEAVTEIVGGAAALLVVPLVAATVWEVLSRYVLGTPTIWAFELGYMLMGVHFLLGGAIALKRQVHVRIDLIYAQLSARRRAIIDLFLYAGIVLPAIAVLCYHSGVFAMAAYASGERSGQSAWNPPIWPFRVLIVFSLVVLALQILAETLKCIRALSTDARYPDA
nr:TRAP transporter small permease subunit [Jiella sp. LLJ827]